MTKLRSIVLPGIAAAAIGTPALLWYTGPSEPDKLTAAIQKIGFYPVTPPNTLRSPGTIYHVSRDGRWTSALCSVDKERLKPVLQISFTEKTVSEELRKARVGLDASVTTKARTTAEADLLQKVSYSLDDVQVYEVSLENLANIAAELQERKSCADQIAQYLRSGDYVCQGQQVLLATAAYSVSTNESAKSHVDTAALSETIKAHIDPEARVTGNLKVGGQGLYYGMKLAPRCMALPGELNKRPPTSWLDRTLNRLGWS